MTEHPILFSAPMVRAILDGRKTQTRRVVKPQPDHHWESLPGYRLDMRPQLVAGGLAVRHVHSIPMRPFAREQQRTSDLGPWSTCPAGAPGDRLWVRETWCLAHPDYHDEAEGIRLGRPVRDDGRWCHYRATDDVDSGDKENASPWRPSIHMPRWASRITLEVTGVRVERLQDITEADAMAEGVDTFDGVAPEQRVPGPGFNGARLGDQPHRLPFADLWEKTYGEDAWDANPWVWVVEFKRVTR